MIDIYAIKALQDNYIWAVVNQDRQSVILVDPGEAKPAKHLTKTGRGFYSSAAMERCCAFLSDVAISSQCWLDA